LLSLFLKSNLSTFRDVMPHSLAHDMNRKDGLSLRKSWNYLVCTLMIQQKPPVKKCCDFLSLIWSLYGPTVSFSFQRLLSSLSFFLSLLFLTCFPLVSYFYLFNVICTSISFYFLFPFPHGEGSHISEIRMSAAKYCTALVGRRWLENRHLYP
jgi:hypothetical protein